MTQDLTPIFITNGGAAHGATGTDHEDFHAPAICKRRVEGARAVWRVCIIKKNPVNTGLTRLLGAVWDCIERILGKGVVTIIAANPHKPYF